MYAGDLISVLDKVVKLQKKHNSQDYEPTNGVWLLYDAERQCIVMVAMTGHTLYWEKTFSVRPDYEKELYEKLQADLTKPDNERCFPCRIIKDDLAWIITLLKSYKNAHLLLEDVARVNTKCKLVLHPVGVPDKQIELPAIAEADTRQSIVEPILYKEMVWHGGDWAKKYMPMEVGGWCCNAYASSMKLVMELMAGKNKKYGEEPITLKLYGMYGEDENEDKNSGYTAKRRYISQHHWEILDANTDAPERGMIHMVVQQPEDYRKHYI